MTEIRSQSQDPKPRRRAKGGPVHGPQPTTVEAGTVFHSPSGLFGSPFGNPFTTALKHWSERDVYTLMSRAEPAMRDELLLAWADRDKALAVIASVAELCDEAEALHLTQPGDPVTPGKVYTDEIRALLRDLS